jgi:hypothetical protein
MTKKYLMKAVVLSLAWVTSISLGAAWVFAQERTQKYHPSSLVVIHEKTVNAVRASRMHFLVTARTKILNQEGKKISLRDLPVPCEAKIQYQEPIWDSNPQALRIVVTRVFPGASKSWTTPLPE